MAKANLTREEMHALLAIEGVNAPAPAGGPSLFRVLLLPHPMTEGVGRALDVILTVAALPLIVAGLLLLLSFGRRRSFAVMTRRMRGRVELTAALFTSFMGAMSIYTAGFLVDIPGETSPMLLAGVGSAALLLRVFVRNAAER